ncbi:MAG: hypothetical protein E7326_05980 [Clostridiales bacterium]|nr:hypothetical protein [Clostridiales bacterium]
MRWLLIILFALWCAPVKLGAAFKWQSGDRGELMLGATLWGVRVARKLAWPESERIAPEEGAQLQREAQEGRGGKEADRRGVSLLIRLIRTVLISNRARGWFVRCAKNEHTHILVQVGFSDAAACALADAIVKALFGMLARRFPGGRFCSRAVLGQKSSVQGMCIVRIRLGNLFSAALLGALGYLASGKKHKEETVWSIIPSKN